MECENCGYMSDLDSATVYGTKCLKCGSHIKPLFKPKFVTDNEFTLKLLQNKVREVLRRRLR